MAYSKLKIFFQDGVWRPSRMVIRGPHNAKIHAELDSSYRKTSKTKYCKTFSDNYLEKLGFLRWHLAAILDILIWGPQNAKPLAEMDASY